LLQNKGNKMKKSLFTVLLAFVATSVFAAGEPQKVCIKNAQGKDVCKTIKVHKKLEGTAVPTKK
jgi:hypothetical protein